MSARHCALFLVLGLLGCLETWKPTGPYACASDGTCADGLTCDDGVCCKPGGRPACPTLPTEGTCPSGEPKRFYFDSDGDGYGAGQPTLLCGRRAGWIAETMVGGRVVLDCDDSDAGLPINPLAPERCNGFDDDCDGEIDEGLAQTPWYRDVDGDGFGSDRPGDVLQACGQPRGFAPRAGDCNVTQSAVNPSAVEACNNVDDNCNGVTDEPPLSDSETPGVNGMPHPCVQDAGVCSQGGLECRRNGVTNLNELICVPRAVPTQEICDNRDNDCNGAVDDPPGCGGPGSFLGTPRVQFGTFRTATPTTTRPSRLPQNCLKSPSVDAQGWLNPSWVGSRAELAGVPLRHTWYAEAEPNTWWDLSRARVVQVSIVDRTQTGTAVFTSAFPGPVVTLCGPTNADYLRLSPNTNQLASNGSIDVALGLTSTPAGWTVERFGAFSLDRVSRVEVTVGPVPLDGGIFNVETFNFLIRPNAGFPP
jgi:hypothetical protein